MKTTDNEQKLFLRKKIKEICKHTISQLVRENIIIDWALLAYEQFNNSHTAADCELRWRGHTHPGVNKAVWKKQEDKELMIIAKTHNFCNWTLIATELGTNRTGFMCLQRYQQSLNPTKITKVFSMDDDTRLREAVRIYGESRWGLVSAYVDGKTPSQCMQRWVNSLKPGIKRGRWNDKEDKLLREAVRKCGVGSWANIAAFVPCRTQAQVRERWVNHMDEKLSKTGWTEEEDRKLIAICQRYSSGPIPWSLVAKEMRTRTDNMCYTRWRSISDAPTIFKKYSESYKQKETVMTNFVGRKRCRHSLRKDDIEEMVPEATKEKLKSYEEMLERKKSRTRELQLPGDPSADSSGASTSGANGGGTSTNRVTAFPPTDMGASATNDGRIDNLERSSPNTANTATPSGTVDATQPSSYSFPQGRFLYIPPSSSPESLPTASVRPPTSKPSDPQPHSQSLPDPHPLPPPTLPQSLPTFSLPFPPPPLPPGPLLIPHNIRTFLSNTVHLPSRHSLQGVYTLPPFHPPTPPTTCLPPSGSISTVPFSESEVDSGSHSSTTPLRIGNLLVPVQRPTRRVVATIWPSSRTERAPSTFPPLFSGQEMGGVGNVSSPTPLQQTCHNLPVAISAHSVSDTHCSSSLPPPLLHLATPAGGNISSCIGEAMNTLLQEATASGDEAPTQTANNSSLSRDKTPNRESTLSTVPAMSSKDCDGPQGGQS
ncbi:Myb-like protein L [Geodia barretti]|nr:Myb-like protein L [Geodia barretti]